MLRKCILIIITLMAFGTPFQAQAQTMDIVMKIQAIFNQISEVRAKLKQFQSGMNIETMGQNMFGDWKEKLKNGSLLCSLGEMACPGSEGGAKNKTLLLLPDGMADNIDDVEKQTEWFDKNVNIEGETASLEEKDDMLQKNLEFKFASILSGYAKAVALRKELDKNLETIEQLRQEAENTESEIDLQAKVNKLALLKQDQMENQQLLKATESQVSGALSMAIFQDTVAAGDAN
ncbi:MAG: hypothetical protein J5787_02310 [Alphaproteobacteria bacterium]|nr:hypothetical protein [Alphaproteobacteria bacterium]